MHTNTLYIFTQTMFHASMYISLLYCLAMCSRTECSLASQTKLSMASCHVTVMHLSFYVLMPCHAFYQLVTMNVHIFSSTGCEHHLACLPLLSCLVSYISGMYSVCDCGSAQCSCPCIVLVTIACTLPHSDPLLIIGPRLHNYAKK